MSETTHISELFGVDVSEYYVVELNKKSFEGIDLSLYPPKRAHLLVYALQFQLSLPSVQTMNKTEERNAERVAKMAGDTTQTAIRRSAKQNILKLKRGMPSGRVARGARGRNTRVRITIRNGISQSSTMMKPQNNIKAPLRPGCVVRCPEQIALKSARTICLQMLQSKWRAQLTQHLLVSEYKPTPAYFIKKKASQTRRRQQRFDLINKYKILLFAIYGKQLFAKRSRISRADIKSKLGLKDIEFGLDGLHDFNEMVEKQQKVIMLQQKFSPSYDEDNDDHVMDQLYKLSKRH